MSRFLFVIESIEVAAGGPPRVLSSIVPLLLARGHEVTIGCVRPKGATVDLADGVEIQYLGDSTRYPWNWLQSGRRLHVLGNQADVVIVSGLWGPIDGVALRVSGMNWNKVFVRTCGMLEPYILSRNAWKKVLGRFLYVDYNLSSVAALIANTGLEKERVESMGFSSPARVIPNGVLAPDEPRMGREEAMRQLDLPYKSDAKVALYLGRIHPKKGLDQLIGPFADFQNMHPEWNLVVAGSFDIPSYKELVENKVRDTGIRGISFVGEVSGSRKTACFALSDAFLLPSHSEGFANAVVEAMAWDIPALVTPGCNFPEIEDFQCGVIAELSFNGLLSGLKKLLSDGQQLREFGTNAGKLCAEKYHLERVVDSYEALASVVSESGSLQR